VPARRGPLLNPAGKGRARRIQVSLDPTDVQELTRRAHRDRLPLSAALLIAARDGFGRQVQARKEQAPFDEGYDHSLQHELILLTLMAVEQVLKVLEAVAPGAAGDRFLSAAAQAAQQRVARGIPDLLGRSADGQP